MSSGWIDVDDGEGLRRHALTAGLTRIGGPGSELVITQAGGDQVHIWNDPPRAIFVGAGKPPTLNGKPLTEQPLAPGDELTWFGRHYTYGGTPAQDLEASLEEVEVAVPAARARQAMPQGRSLDQTEERLWDRMIAGMLVEQGLADQASAKRWQGKVIEGGFNPDTCAQEILARSGISTRDPRLDERTSRLLRDFLMAPLMRGARGASRKAKRAAKGSAAYVIANLVALGVFSAIVFVALLLMRVNHTDINGFLDQILRR